MAAGESETVEIQKREKRVRGRESSMGMKGWSLVKNGLLLERLGKVYDGVIARKYALVEVSVLP